MIEKIILTGTSKEIGEQHGRLGRNQIIQSLETYEKLFRDYQFISWNEAREMALHYVKAIEKYDDQLLEEMEGVAKGAGVDIEDILALNARTEIALGSYGNRQFTDGCTAIATTSPISHDTIIGQNWDWKGAQTKSLLLLEVHRKNKPVITMMTEGGIIGKIGYNSAGLGLCFNALLTDRKANEVPIHLALRGVLNSFTLSEAISKIKDGQTAASASLLIGKSEEDGSGMVINVEVSPFGIDYVGGDKGFLVHTNHIMSPVIKKHLLDMNEYRFEDSMLRYKRAQQLINIAIKKNEKIDHEVYKKWLSDTFNAPNSINHLCNPHAEEHRQMETVFSIIMNLTKRKTFLSIGKPAEGQFIEI